MKTNNNLTDAELERMAASKDSSLAIPALLELRKRSDQRTFWGVTVPAWLAVVIAIIAILNSEGILKFHRDKDSKPPINASNTVSNTAVKK